MKGERGRLYTEERDFFELEGHAVMTLTAEAAIAVCRSAVAHGLVVARIEGGFWLSPGFEARYDCIWNGVDPPIGVQEATVNNNEAAAFVERQRKNHDAFILTAPPMTGWPHRSREKEQ